MTYKEHFNQHKKKYYLGFGVLFTCWLGYELTKPIPKSKKNIDQTNNNSEWTHYTIQQDNKQTLFPKVSYIESNSKVEYI